MRGRKPRPTAQKRLEGNPGKRPLPTDEPAPPASASLFDDPPELKHNPIALAEWQRLALTNPLWITDVDRGLLLESCELYARMRVADAMVRKTGGAVITTTAGNVIQNPHVGVARRAYQDYRLACVELGFTPSARSRIRVDGDPDPPAAGATGAAGDDYRGFVQ
jgi:P27 family predicted phage terminase small subunit